MAQYFKLRERSQMKSHFVMALAMMLIVTNAWDLRFLQSGWSDPNCAQWSSDGMTCLKCIPRSYNNTDQNKCIRVDDNCKTWSQTNGECLTCYDSYGDAWKNGKAINGKCPYYNGPQIQNMTMGEENITLPENMTMSENMTTAQNMTLPENVTVGAGAFQYDSNCKCYSDNKVCLECYQGYELDSQGICQTVKPTVIANCLTVTNGKCVECQSGFYLDSTGSCVQLPANCTKADQNGACTECETGFVLTVNKSLCVEQVANCTQYSPDGVCEACDTQFYLNSQSMCDLLPSNCVSADPTGACTMCDIGYALVLGECQLAPSNCNITNRNGICVQCDAGFYLDTQMECQTLPQNCTEANPKGRCTQCENDLIVSDGECVVNAGQNLNCAEQNAKGKCTKCRNFYDLKNGDCISTGQNPFCKEGACECGTNKCTECKKGYFLDNNGICEAKPQNCKEYSKSSGECITCQKDFNLTSGQCVPANMTVSKVNLNCKNQTENGTCTECRKNYKLIDGQCAAITNPKCKTYNKDKVCTCCYYSDKYYLDNNGICVEMNPNCAQINTQTGQCTSCDKGYTLSEGSCVASS